MIINPSSVEKLYEQLNSDEQRDFLKINDLRDDPLGFGGWTLRYMDDLGLHRFHVFTHVTPLQVEELLIKYLKLRAFR